nr:hypothetical protein [Tanacetum cinerariifolium]
MSLPQTGVSVRVPFGGVTNWYPDPSSIFVGVLIAPEVGAATVASPSGVLELDTHSSSKADPLESTLPPRTRVASRSSSPTTSTQEIPTTLIPLAPSTVDIPIGRLYNTHPGGPCTALIVRKSVRPLPSHHFALRYTSHHLDRFTSGSSLVHSSLDHSSSGHSILGYSLSKHTPPVTIVADSSAPLRFVYPPHARTPWDSSSELFVRPSRKRCRSPTATVTSFIDALRALVPSRADLLPPRKRFRDSISPEDSVEEDIDTDVLADIEADAIAVEVAADMDDKAKVNACIGMEVDIGVDVEDEVESSDRGTIKVGVDVVVEIDYPRWHVIEIPLQRVEDIKMGQRELKARSLIAGGQRASLLGYKD